MEFGIWLLQVLTGAQGYYKMSPSVERPQGAVSVS
jgi:hypothetical protein